MSAGGRDADLSAFVLRVASYTAPAGSDSVEVLTDLVHRARDLCHAYYLEPPVEDEDEDEDEDVALGLAQPDLDVCTCSADDTDAFDPACPVHGAEREDDTSAYDLLRRCAACGIEPAARGDRYCPACGTARDREAWADPVPAPADLEERLRYCRAVLMVPLEVGRVSHICTRPAGHAGDHRSSLTAPNGRDRYTWSVAELVP